ncbi:MAG: hypothetical protein HIU57_07920, partial [Acidobacteria bacterium]|nr:hypothetical protein [Acidobacteriota bacterium]
ISATSLNSLTIAGAGASSTTVNGHAAGSVFSVASGTVTFSGLTVTNGKAGDGGGIFNISLGAVSVTDSTLSNNTANTGGGGIYNDNTGTVSVTDSTLSDNSAVLGGGIYNRAGTVNVTDSTLFNNSADGYGGGIYNVGTLNVTDSTLAANRARLVGGIYSSGSGTANLGASIITGSTGVNCLGTTTDGGDNLSGGSTCGPLTVTTGLILGNLANNGGPTDTLLPLPGNVAVGAIPLNTTINSVQVCPRIDQRGLASNGPCTIGAVQMNLQTISFTSTAPSATVGGPSYTPTATSTSGLIVTIKVDSTSSGVCSINASGVVSFVASGTCTLDATQAGDANYAAATPVQQSITVGWPSSGLLAQAPLTLTSTRGVVDTPLTLMTTGGSGTGALSYLVSSAGTASCTLHGDMLTATSAGTCTLLVTKAGDATYLAAISASTTVSFTSAALTQAPLTLTSTRGVVDTPLTLTTSGGSGTGVVSFALSSAGSASCTLNGDTLTATSAGTCTLSVTKAGDPTYAASSVIATVTFAARLFATRVTGDVGVGRTSLVTITGSGFYDKPTMRSNDAHTSAVVIHDHGTALIVRVRVLPGAATGWHDFTITLANGRSCRVRYLAKTRLSATRVEGSVQVGPTSLVTITGTGFYLKPTIRSNDAHTSAVVIHDHGTALVVRVRVLPGAATGWHVFTITLANGRSCRVRYWVK